MRTGQRRNSTKKPSKPLPLVSASDVGAWAFCQRAWWLARVQGAEHRNPAVLQRGDEMHASHGRTVSRAAWLQRAALVLIGVAVLLLIVMVAGRWW